MKFTLSWLKSHLDTDASVDEISKRLTMIGLEVEEVINPAEKLKGFTVAEVETAGNHPDADKLQLLSVNTGSENLQIVCGAPNARQGLKSVLACVGQTIPCYGEKLKKGKIRGVESFGMLCSESELLVGDGHDGIIELPEDAVVGAPVTDYLKIDTIFDISITPNRGDCLGVRGIARDLAASGLGKLKDMPIEKIEGTFKSPISVSIDLELEKKKACPMFVGRMVKNIENKESPQWLKDRLNAIGLKPISALVDITNFISYDLARPLHVFDVDKLQGDLHVRLGKEGEKMVALDEKEYVLDGEIIAVCDDNGVQALGGVMGGDATGCVKETKNVFIESALFDPIRIAGTGRKLQIESDARFRFERWVDPASAIDGAELATKLIMEFCGGEASELVIAGEEPDWKQSIVFRPERVKQLCAVDISLEESKRILNDLGFETGEHGDALLISTPSWRGDIEGEHDIVEEVIRIYGYDKLPVISPVRDPMPKIVRTDKQRNEFSARRALAGNGMSETLTWAFMDSSKADLFKTAENKDKKICLANPISSDLGEMRPSILANLLDASVRNDARGYSDVALFEIGPEFTGTEPGDQRAVIAGLRTGMTGARNWAMKPRQVDVFDIKDDVMVALAAISAPASAQESNGGTPPWYHPGRSGSISLGRNVIAYFGELHPRVLKKMNVKSTAVAFEIYLENAPVKKMKSKSRPLLKASQLQPVNRDFAFVVDSKVQASDIIRAAQKADKNLVSDVTVFDHYEGSNMEEGKKSVAIQVTLQPEEKTLTDKEIDSVAKNVVHFVGKITGGELRS